MMGDIKQKGAGPIEAGIGKLEPLSFTITVIDNLSKWRIIVKNETCIRRKMFLIEIRNCSRSGPGLHDATRWRANGVAALGPLSHVEKGIVNIIYVHIGV